MSSWKLSDLRGVVDHPEEDRRITCPIHFMMRTLPPRCRLLQESRAVFQQKAHIHSSPNHQEPNGDPDAILQGLFQSCSLQSSPPSTARHLCLWVLSGFFLKARRIAQNPQGFSLLFYHCHRQTHSLSFCELVFLLLLDLFLLPFDYCDLNMEHIKTCHPQPQAVTSTNAAVLDTG